MTSFNNVELDGGMNCGGGGLELKKAKHPKKKKKKLTICYESNGGIHTHTHKTWTTPLKQKPFHPDLQNQTLSGGSTHMIPTC